LFGEPLSNDNYFFSYVFRLKEFFLFFYFFKFFVWMKFIFKNNNFLFLDNNSNIRSLACCFFSSLILFNQFNLCLYSIIVCLNKKIILINKFSKHNWINIPLFEIKYIDLLLSLDL